MKTDDQSCKGFLIFCDKNREKMAIKDAYNFLSEYVQATYSDVAEEHIRKKIKSDGLELNLENQVVYGKKAQNKLFFQIETNVNCICFVKINSVYKQIDPNVIVDKLMNDVHKEGKEITRFCHRILPVERAFKAEHFRMIDQLEELFFMRGNKQIKSWMLNFKCRNNNKFNYKEVLFQVQKIAKKYGHFTDIYFPQWTVSVQITNHLMCIGISQNFKETLEFKLHKKNNKLQLSCEVKDQKEVEPKVIENKQKQRQSKINWDQKKRQDNEAKQSDLKQTENKESLLLHEKIEICEDDIDLL